MRAVHWFVTLPLIVVLLIFAISNRQDVEITFWPLPVAIQTPLFIAVLLAMAAAFVVGELVAWMSGRRWRRDAREKSRRIDALERELAATQARLKSQATGVVATGGLLMKQP